MEALCPGFCGPALLPGFMWVLPPVTGGADRELFSLVFAISLSSIRSALLYFFFLTTPPFFMPVIPRSAPPAALPSAAVFLVGTAAPGAVRAILGAAGFFMVSGLAPARVGGAVLPIPTISILLS